MRSSSTSWRSQILSNRLLGISPSSARRRPRPAARASSSPLFSKWCGRSASKVTLSPAGQLVALAVDEQVHRALEDDRGLAAPGLVHRRVVRAAGGGAGGERVHRDVRPLARQRRRQLLDRVAAPAADSAVARADDDDVPRSRRGAAAARATGSSPAAIRAATASVGLVSPRSTWESIGALTPQRSARSRSDRSIASRRAFTRRADPGCRIQLRTRRRAIGLCRGSRHAAYVITYVCISVRSSKPRTRRGAPDASPGQVNTAG